MTVHYESRGPARLTRASVGAYRGADGLVKWAPVDAPRFEPDPIRGGIRFLWEDAAKNLVRRSKNLNNTAAWTRQTSLTVVNDATTAPDGGLADKLQETAAASYFGLQQTPPEYQALTEYTFSVWGKAAERSRLLVRFLNITGAKVLFDLADGSIPIQPTTGSARTEAWGDGWFRCIFTFTTDDVADPAKLYFAISPATTTGFSYTGTAGYGIYAWGAQLEEGPDCTSLIETFGGPATRAADFPVFVEGPDLLPPNGTAQERALELVAARTGIVPNPVRASWDPDTCPAALLPWLAWALGVDQWQDDLSDEAKREIIRGAAEIRRQKGTVAAVKRAISLAGFGDSTIVEGNPARKFDGSATYNGTWRYGDPADWARYVISLNKPISNAQADSVRAILKNVAPARCELVQLSFVAATYFYNGAMSYDGTYNHGAA
jgi:phage tail P2-like protein